MSLISIHNVFMGISCVLKGKLKIPNFMECKQENKKEPRPEGLLEMSYCAFLTHDF